MGMKLQKGPWPVEQDPDLEPVGLGLSWLRGRQFVFLSLFFSFLLSVLMLELLPRSVYLQVQGQMGLLILALLPVAAMLTFVTQLLLMRAGVSSLERPMLLTADGQRAGFWGVVERAAVATVCLFFPPLLLLRPQGRWLWDAVSETRLVHRCRIRDDELDAAIAGIDEDI